MTPPPEDHGGWVLAVAWFAVLMIAACAGCALLAL